MKNYTIPDDLQALVDAHGHLCFGSILGYKACKYAEDIIGRTDNMKVIAQGAGCANDAFKVLLNCTTENGRLVVEQGNKQAWSFYNYDEEEGIHLTVNANLAAQLPKDKDQALKYVIELPGGLIFNAEPFSID